MAYRELGALFRRSDARITLALILFGSACSGPVKGHRGAPDDNDDAGYVGEDPEDAARPACTDNEGTPDVCHVQAGDAGVCATLDNYCTNVRDGWKPGVSAALVSCLNTAVDCTDQALRSCAKSALFSACEDPATEPACAEIETLCSGTVPVTIEQCHHFIDGMLDTGRQKVLACLRGGDGGLPCPSGLFACVTGL